MEIKKETKEQHIDALKERIHDLVNDFIKLLNENKALRAENAELKGKRR